MVLASSYQFCRVDAKTDDHFFLGFPSYWNIVAFYVYVLVGLAVAIARGHDVPLPLQSFWPAHAAFVWVLQPLLPLQAFLPLQVCLSTLAAAFLRTGPVPYSAMNSRTRG